MASLAAIAASVNGHLKDVRPPDAGNPVQGFRAPIVLHSLCGVRGAGFSEFSQIKEMAVMSHLCQFSLRLQILHDGP